MMRKIYRRAQKTRSAIKQAYIHLIEQFPEDEITVLMISQYADINRATFYAHFSNKTELLEEMLEDLLEGLREAILSPFQKEHTINVSTLTPTTVQIFEYFEKNKQMVHALYIGHRDFKKHMEELFIHIFSKDIQLELKSEIGEVDYDIFLHYQTSATLGLIFYWIKGNFEYPVSYMTEQLTILSNTQVTHLKGFQY
jgi:AcrR family transcriptional regulator